MALHKSKDIIDEAVAQLVKFKTGELKPISTGVNHLDNALLGGLLPSTVLGIVGSSQHGKSWLYEKIQRHIMSTHDDVQIIVANWELELNKLLVRDLSVKLGISPKEVLFDPIEKNQAEFKKVCDSHRVDNVLYQNEPVTPEDFEKDIDQAIIDYKDKRIVVIIDNLENLLIEGGSQKSSMDKLLYKINRLKKTHPYICFIILNQMNREYSQRLSEPKLHRPRESDIYGSGQLYKLCDVLLIKIMPFKFSIWDQFMHIRKGEYEYLDEFKNDPDAKHTSFDPYGRDFYFYIKTRMPEKFDEIKDIFIEQIFERKDQQIRTLPKHPSSLPEFLKKEEKNTDQKDMEGSRPSNNDFDEIPF